MSYYDENLSDSDKMRIVSQFLLHAPPGEFNEVLTDVRYLIDNDTLLREQASGTIAQYHMDQLTPVQVEGSDHGCLITEYNSLSNGRFYDPRTKKSFKYDFIREEASDYQPWTPDSASESWRSSLEDAWTTYCKEHYYNGNCSVFSSSSGDKEITLTACIEGHLFQARNYCNGRWRSVWTTKFNPSSGGQQAELRGIINIQVHYFEDGNVQLVTQKEVKKMLNVSSESQLAHDFLLIVETAENEYQTAVSENYQTMSDTTFKALRRPLPVTKNKIDWTKILNYKIGSEIKQN
ncbi:F-actin-capping protein subunit alpha [Brevipalpus obovatus]|uniref:F-actin-capping protein subunit alpha n=1 Tax=Brevipalpus obovatus TaxID=246614 RepID=UPI003D9E759A